MLSLRRTGERLLGRLPWGTPARRHKRRPFSSRFRRNQGASRQEKWPHAASWAVPGGRAAQAPPSLFFSTALSLNRHAKRRDLNERPLVELLRKAGFLVHRNDRLCDLIVCDPGTGVVNVEYIRPAMADVKIGEISVTKNVDTGALDVRVSDYSFQEKLTQALEHAVQAITTLAGSAPTSP